MDLSKAFYTINHDLLIAKLVRQRMWAAKRKKSTLDVLKAADASLDTQCDAGGWLPAGG